MRIYVSSPPLASDTAYGYELRYLDMARKLLDAGISLKDLKECRTNLAWAFEIVKNDFDAQIKKATNNIYGDINGNN